MSTGPAGTAPARLLEMLEKDELDWDNEQHRIAYLKAWVAGQLPRPAAAEDAPVER
jgi:hypothetical protein